MRIIELFTMSKSGNADVNEDGVFYNDNFVAVVDGATAKSHNPINGTSSGRFAMLAVKEAFMTMSPNDCPATVIRNLNKRLNTETKSLHGESFADPPIASVIYYNDRRKEIVSCGDCMCSVNGVLYKDEKKSDRRLAKKRAAVIKAELKKGIGVDDIRKNDVGRLAILDELKEQAVLYANDPNNGFPCINGGDVQESFLRVLKVNDGDIVELASDGYTELCGSLSRTENRLKELLAKDVLCVEELLSTKCVAIGNDSFDDRSYIRFVV